MIDQTMHVESGVLIVIAKGEFSLEAAKRAFIQMRDSVAQHQVNKVLFDGRQVTGNPEAMQRFLYGAFAADETAKLHKHHLNPRFAYVLHVPLRDPGRFGETVAVNRGMKVKTFEMVDEALEWLNGPPPTDRGTREERLSF